MSFYLPALWQNVRNRIILDNAPGGFFPLMGPFLLPSQDCVTNVWRDPEADPATDYPLIVYQTISARGDEMMRTDRHEVDWELALLVPAERDTGSAWDPLSVAATILGRLYGDWTDQAAGTPPSYGFNRWTPALADTGWTANPTLYIDTREEHEPGLYQWVMSFRTGVNKAGV